MNNRNRHLNYRKNIYRKRRMGAVLIFSIVAVALIFALFLIIGTALHSKTKEPEATDKPLSDTVGTDNKLPEAATVGAYSLPLLEDGSTFSTRLSNISSSANAVCINLNTRDGTLLFNSSLASELSHLKVHKDATSLSSAVASIERSGFYTSAVLYVPSFEESNDLLRDVDLATWGAIASEALRDGVGDVLIIANAMSATDVGRICALSDSIHSNVDGAMIGLAIPDSVLSDENGSTLIKELSLHFNYLSLDTTTYKTDEDPVSFIKSRVSTLLLEIMFYKMRVLLPRSSDTQVQQQYIDTVTTYNITSWQILP